MREIKFRVWSISMTGGHGKMHYLTGNFSGKDLIEEERWKVMQYTGLKDKNGKEIYEGDVVEWGAGVIFEVAYSGCSFNLYDKDDEFHGSIGEYYPIEIIGNIYENPELLEQK